MENVIGEHLSSLENYRNIDLIFNPEPIFIKNHQELFIFGIKVYQKEGIYQNGEREGLWISWYGNGQKLSERNYRNGEAEGLWISWHPNGQKASEGNYRNGKKDGIWTYWYENGQKHIEGNYVNGVKKGLWVIYEYY